MTDSIERRIAELQLPEPTPDLDRRIRALFPARRPPRNAAGRGRIGALAAAASALAAGLLAVLFHSPTPHKTSNEIPNGNRRGQTPVVETVNVKIPILEMPRNASVIVQDKLFPPGTIVVSTSTQQDQMK
jgi:hypothetical protein